MADFFTPDEAIRYFGLKSLEDLEEVCADYDLDYDLDKNGNLIGVNAEEARDVLFELHKEKVGHRPDDPEYMKKAEANRKRRESSQRLRREQRKGMLVRRVAGRKAAATRRGGKK